jgi:GNAT superfamily N-acetyltransferase
LDTDVLTDGWVVSPFTLDDRFSDRWWQGSLRGPASWLSFFEGADEVARAKVKVNSLLGAAYPTWTVPSAGATEIDLLEVREGRRGRGIGEQVVADIVDRFPPPYVAMSLDETSNGFWRRLGWLEHSHEDDDGHRQLFTWTPGPDISHGAS